MPDETGESRAQRNEKFNQETPAGPDVPEQVEHVWAWFWEISGQRQDSSTPISWEDLNHWRTRTGNDPAPEELDMLLAMDRAYRTAVGEFHKEAQERMRKAAKSKGK